MYGWLVFLWARRICRALASCDINFSSCSTTSGSNWIWTCNAKKIDIHFTASLLSPFFCLAVEEGFVWPQVILVLPMAKVCSKKIQCYVLQRVDPQLNDVDHTKVQMPAQHAFCSKSFEACNRRVQCSAQGKIHLQSIAIKNILACALYKSPAGKKLQSAFSKTPCGNFELNNTTQAVKIRESFHQHRKLYFDDYVLESTVWLLFIFSVFVADTYSCICK